MNNNHNPANIKKINSLKVAILAEINLQGSFTGYSLTKSIPDSVNWHASHQQVYRECHGLMEQGFLKVVSKSNEGKPDSRFYSITKAGRQALTDIRTMSEFTPSTFKSPLTVMLHAGSHSYLKSVIEAHQETINRINEALQALNGKAQSDVKRLSLELERDIAEAELKWAYKAQKHLLV